MQHKPTNAPKGVLLVVAAVTAFAVGDVAGKHLSMLYAVPLIAAARYLINLGLLTAFLLPRHGRGLWQTRRTGLVILRGLCLAVGSLTMMLALQVMPVGETVAIIYLSPFLVMLVAGRFLNETVPLAGWIGAAAGFVGVLLIVRPGSGLDPMGVTLSLINAGFATAYTLLTRILSRTETTQALVFHTALVGAVLFGALAFWFLDTPWPQGSDLALTVLLGGLATLGHVLFTLAYREAPASLLAPVNYLHVVIAAILGAVVFSHVPDTLAMAGMALVVLSGMAVALRARTIAPTDPV